MGYKIKKRIGVEMKTVKERIQIFKQLGEDIKTDKGKLDALKFIFRSKKALELE